MIEISQEQKRDELWEQLLFLFFPIKQILEADDCWRPKITHVRAAFNTQRDVILPSIRAFCTIQGLFYETEFTALRRWLSRFRTFLDRLEQSSSDSSARREFREEFKAQMGTLKTLFKSVPCEIPDFILPANRPFDAYRRLRSLIQIATKRVELFDAYCSADVFHRYLADIDASVSIVVVTNPDTMKVDVKDSFLAVSELLAAQRPTTYTLVMNSKFHDRYLRLDDTIWHLGGSLKDAAWKAPFTCTQHESNATNNKDLDDLMSNGDEWCGPTVTKHRKS